MARPKIALMVSVLSLLIATGAVTMLFSMQKAASPGNAHLSATLYEDPSGAEIPMPVLPEMVNYHQTAAIPLDFKRVAGLAVDGDDRIYVAGDKSVCRYSPRGKLDMQIRLSDEPTCLTVANRQHLAPGRIYVGFVDHLEVYESNGAEAAIWQGLGDKARISSISSSEQYIFIADAGQNVVQRFDWTGKLLESFGESNPGHFTAMVNGVNAPFDLVVGMDELVYVVDRRDQRVEGYTHFGRFESHWGHASPAIGDFAGSNNPCHIALDESGQFVTAEENPLRVKVCSRTGEFESVVCGPEGCGTVAGLAADQRHRILVLDGQARCVRVFELKKTAVDKSGI